MWSAVKSWRFGLMDPLVFLWRQRSVRGLETGQNWQIWKNNRIYAHKSAGMTCEFQSTNSLQSVTWLKAQCLDLYIYSILLLHGWMTQGRETLQGEETADVCTQRGGVTELLDDNESSVNKLLFSFTPSCSPAGEFRHQNTKWGNILSQKWRSHLQ